MMKENIEASSHTIEKLNILVSSYKKKILLKSLLTLLPWLLVSIFIGLQIDSSISSMAIVVLLMCSGATLLRLNSLKYKQVTLNTLLLHLNRHYSQLQESAHLITADIKELSVLQKLQKKRVLTQIDLLISDEQSSLLPIISDKNAIISFCVALIILVFLSFNSIWLPLLSNESNRENETVISEEGTTISAVELLLVESEVTIIPPSYTQLQQALKNDLNVNAVAGSVVHWNLVFNGFCENAFIILSNGERVSFDTQDNLRFEAKTQINHTGIYRLGVLCDGREKVFPDIYTLTAIKDNKPKIKIITPKKTITEIATNQKPYISTQVQITDDFNISKVEILASIAKGSGESVKFRDQIFLFDSQEIIDGVNHYNKNWLLSDLKMEPGDELYFTVKAWDNRQPSPQLSRSSTKIIRWLEDEHQGVMSDGILIDFMPEYFKSQRQIIIETVELIDDKDELLLEKFVDTSELLGVSQSELKEKYGQYLGDEVEDGGGSHAISHEATEHISELEEHDTMDESDHHHDESGGHSESESTFNNAGVNKFSRAQLINQFGHNHEEADIGIMARQDPKALMKRSIANMWQAELHLMLSEPAKALPFEYEALKYLKMAKKAERIYVKRLGFEPPPVSEQRRYQGDLSDVLTYQRQQKVNLSENDESKLRELFLWLNTITSKTITPKPISLSLAQRQLIENVKKQFEQQVENRPALIKYVAILERIILSNTLALQNCQLCIPELTKKLWQLLPDPAAKPFTPRKSFNNSDLLINSYAEFLSEQL